MEHLDRPTSPLNQWELAVYNRYLALVKASKTMERLPDDFMRSCRSALTFAQFESPSLDIAAIGSRNTLYKHADRLFSHLFSPEGLSGRFYLEWLRKTLYEKYRLSKHLSGGRSARSRERVRDELDEYKVLLNQTQKAMLAQSSAYISILREVSAVAKDARVGELGMKRLMNILNDHDEKYSAIFSPNVFEDLRPKNVKAVSDEER